LKAEELARLRSLAQNPSLQFTVFADGDRIYYPDGDSLAKVRMNLGMEEVPRPEDIAERLAAGWNAMPGMLAYMARLEAAHRALLAALPKAVADPGTGWYRSVMRTVEEIEAEMKKLQEAP